MCIKRVSRVRIKKTETEQEQEESSMTFREKYYKDFPIKEGCNPAERMCPSSFDYEEYWDCDSSGIDCEECWDRETPEPEKEPKFIIEIETEFPGIGKVIEKLRTEDERKREKDTSGHVWEDDGRKGIEIRSDGLDDEEKEILEEEFRRAIRRIRHRRRKENRPDIMYKMFLR